MGGEVRVNGHKVRDMVVISKVMGFVPQDDIVHEDLTVQENFAYQASPGWSSCERVTHDKFHL